MPCYTVVMEKKDKVYRLVDLIADQFAADPRLSLSWRQVSVQSSPENVDARGDPIPIKGGNEDLDGLNRYGYVLMTGQTKQWGMFGSEYPHVDDKYFLCEQAAGMKLSVELL